MTSLDAELDHPEEPRPPFHLRADDAPVTDEVIAADLPAVGALPSDLCGRHPGNGPEPRSGRSEHWFLADGTMSGIRLRVGEAERYRNDTSTDSGGSMVFDTVVVAGDSAARLPLPQRVPCGCHGSRVPDAE